MLKHCDKPSLPALNASITPYPVAYSKTRFGVDRKGRGRARANTEAMRAPRRIAAETEVTVRALAKATGYSKSTVHKDLTERLPNIDGKLAEDDAKVLASHKSVRH